VKNRAELSAKFRSTIETIERHGIEYLKETQPKWVSPLSHISEPLSELRIPPTRKGGVLRVYFFRVSEEEICLLDIQFKRGKDRADTASAQKRYREISLNKDRCK
jgi:phage-related protein